MSEARKVSFARLLRQLVAEHGERIALINTERERRLTFRELDALSNRIANMMQDALGLREGDRYGLILENDNLSLMHFWTFLKCPATALLCNVRDPFQEHLRQLTVAKVKCVFLESAMARDYAPALAQSGIVAVAMDGGVSSALSFWELTEAASARVADLEVDAEHHSIFLRFTGGTTGASKCAVFTHASFDFMVTSFLTLPDHPFHRQTRTLHLAPLSHGSFMIAAPTFMAGGCNVTQNRPDLAEWCRNVQRHRINTAFLVPTLLYRLLTMPEAHEHDLSTLTTAIYGAAPMSPAKLVQLRERFGDIFVQLYGATESPGAICCLTKADHVIEAGSDPLRLQSCGRVLPTGELKIVGDDGGDLPQGEIGEFWHRHRGIIPGYLDDPQATTNEFADGWWKSGDLGFIDRDGYCHIIDRKKDMIISGGFNVYATEVENALATHPDVVMSAVVGAPHEEWGEAVIAEIVLRENARASEAELIEHAKRLLGSYKAPKRIVFVSQLPASAVGKVLRREVRAKYWSGTTRKVN